MLRGTALVVFGGSLGCHADATPARSTDEGATSTAAATSMSTASATGDDTTTASTSTTTTTADDTSTHGGVETTGTTGGGSPIAWDPAFDDRALVCKLFSDTGIDDPTANATHTRFNLRGTDLGAPAIVGDRLYLFLGDSVGYRLIWDFGEDPDAVAWVDANAARDDVSVLCNALEVLVTPDVPSVAAGVDPTIARDFAGAAMAAPRGESLADYIAQPAGPQFPFMPGTFEVPAGAMAMDDAVWIFYAGLAELTPRARATLGYLVQWQPGPLPTHQIVRPVDRLDAGALGGHFIQVAPVLHDQTVWMFGTGNYRFGGVYLARVAGDGLADGGDTEVFDPTSEAWHLASTLDQVAREAIVPLFETDGVGEIGVQWIAEADVWLAMYQRELHDGGGNIVDNRIVLRTAARPEGPWSEALTIVDMADPAFTAEHCCGATCEGPQLLHCLVAGLYAAYPLPVIDVVARGEGFALDVPFVVSTWDPYNVALMRTAVTITPVY